jgi:hypothetical protein
VDREEDSRPIFAHLKLRADSIDANALDTSPTIKALACVIGPRPSTLLAATVAVTSGVAARC